MVIGGARRDRATAVAIVAYLVLSTQSQHRLLLGTVCVAWAIASSGLFVIPRRRLAASHLREPFFLAWSGLVIASFAVGIVLEGRPGTPLTAGFILPIIFAAISYPVRETVITGVMVLFAAAIACVLSGHPAADTTFLLLALGFGAVMGVWQALGRNRRAAQLAAEHRRAHQAHHDGLTGLANRAKLEEHLTAALARARRHDLAAAVLYIDLDRFKHRQRHASGHAVGRRAARATRGGPPAGALRARRHCSPATAATSSWCCSRTSQATPAHRADASPQRPARRPLADALPDRRHECRDRRERRRRACIPRDGATTMRCSQHADAAHVPAPRRDGTRPLRLFHGRRAGPRRPAASR